MPDFVASLEGDLAVTLRGEVELCHGHEVLTVASHPTAAVLKFRDLVTTTIFFANSVLIAECKGSVGPSLSPHQSVAKLVLLTGNFVRDLGRLLASFWPFALSRPSPPPPLSPSSPATDATSFHMRYGAATTSPMYITIGQFTLLPPLGSNSAAAASGLK